MTHKSVVLALSFCALVILHCPLLFPADLVSTEIPFPDGLAAVTLADLDGDSHTDLLTVSADGLLRSYRNLPRAGISPQPWQQFRLPPHAALFDFFDCDADSIPDLVFLAPDRVAFFPCRRAGLVTTENVLLRLDLLLPVTDVPVHRNFIRTDPGLPYPLWFLPVAEGFQLARLDRLALSPGIVVRCLDLDQVRDPVPGSLDPLSLKISLPHLHLADFDGDRLIDALAKRDNDLLLWRNIPQSPRPDPELFHLKRPDADLTAGALNLAAAAPAVGDFDGDHVAEVVVLPAVGAEILRYSLKKTLPLPADDLTRVRDLSPLSSLKDSGSVIGAVATDIDGDHIDDLLITSVPEIDIPRAIGVLLTGKLEFTAHIYRGSRPPAFSLFGRNHDPFHDRPDTQFSVQTPLTLAFAEDRMFLGNLAVAQLISRSDDSRCDLLLSSQGKLRLFAWERNAFRKTLARTDFNPDPDSFLTVRCIGNPAPDPHFHSLLWLRAWSAKPHKLLLLRLN